MKVTMTLPPPHKKHKIVLYLHIKPHSKARIQLPLCQLFKIKVFIPTVQVPRTVLRTIVHKMARTKFQRKFNFFSLEKDSRFYP